MRICWIIFSRSFVSGSKVFSYLIFFIVDKHPLLGNKTTVFDQLNYKLTIQIMRKIYVLDKPNWEFGNCLISEYAGYIFELKIEHTITKNYYHYSLANKFHHCKIKENQNIENYFFESSNQYENVLSHTDKLIKLDKIPGEFHPRIYRPILQQYVYSNGFSYIPKTDAYDFFPHDPITLVKSVQQLSTLTKRLNSIFNNVYPTQDNINCYGHEIRNLLILTCTEVEAQLKGILTANGYDTSKMCKTSDYVKLKEILKLNEYKVNLSHFPEVDPISPFKDWDITKPTSSLFWYDNYNAVKHDREGNFHKANLSSVINAICAVAILLYAQYGDNIPNWKELVGNYFEKVDEPKWQFLDHYFPPFYQQEWIEIKLSI
jgi:hypothetical protein